MAPSIHNILPMSSHNVGTTLHNAPEEKEVGPEGTIDHGSDSETKKEIRWHLRARTRSGDTVTSTGRSQKPWWHLKRTEMDMLGFYFLAVLVVLAYHQVFLSFSGRVLKTHYKKNERYLWILAYQFISVFLFAIYRSLGTAYHQIVFYRLRRTTLTVLQVDRLLHLFNNSVTNVVRYKFGRKALRERGFVVIVTLMMPMASFPLGSFSSRWSDTTENIVLEVPNVNLTYRTSETWPGIDSVALFSSGNGTDSMLFRQPRQLVRFLTFSTLTSENPSIKLPMAESKVEQKWESGTDFTSGSYELTFAGPRYKCTERDLTDTEAQTMLSKDGTQFSMSGDGRIFEALYKERIEIGTYSDGGAAENLQQTPDDKEKYKSINCTLGTASYRANVYFYYDDSTSIGEMGDSNFESITATPSLSGYFGDSKARQLPYDHREQGSNSGNPLWKRFLEMQSLAISTALVDTLRGSIKDFASDSEVITNTRIVGTRFAKLDKTNYLQLNITEAALNKALTDITISLPTLPTLDTIPSLLTPVRIKLQVHRYHFNYLMFYLPFGLILFISLILIICGIYCLRQNGIPASDRFLNVVCATAGSRELRRVALAQLENGGDMDEDFAEELTSLKIRYGRIRSGLDGGRGAVGDGAVPVPVEGQGDVMCFVTEEEAAPVEGEETDASASV